MSPFELLRVVRRGAVADLQPLRNVLLDEINPAVMRQVAEARAQNRRLYVGAVDVDSGQAMAMDLTQMARDYVTAGPAGAADETAAQHRLRACYVDAIVASSSAPLAAVPVFIDNSMYVDGGMRFGMFANDVITGAGRAAKANGRRSEFYVIANGDLETEVDCGRARGPVCDRRPAMGLATDPRSQLEPAQSRRSAPSRCWSTRSTVFPRTGSSSRASWGTTSRSPGSAASRSTPTRSGWTIPHSIR